jgi:hypothetical protein
MAEQGRLNIADPLLAAGQLAGLILWVPVNQALLCGHNPSRGTKSIATWTSGCAHSWTSTPGKIRVEEDRNENAR